MNKQHIADQPNDLSLLIKALYLLQSLNLDVVAGAVISHMMVQKLVNSAETNIVHYFALASAVFVVYSLDRLSDADIIKTSLQTRRHKFYLQHSKKLLSFTIVLGLVTGIIALIWLPLNEIVFGAVLGLFSLIYLWLVRTNGQKQNIWLSKELFVAIIYTAGIWGSAIIHAGGINLQTCIIGLSFFLVALQNLFLFSLFDKESDEQHQQKSVVTSLGETKVKFTLLCIFSTTLLINLGLYLYGVSDYGIRTISVITLMSIVLHLLLIFRNKFKNNDNYRWLGDGVFLLPIFII